MKARTVSSAPLHRSAPQPAAREALVQLFAAGRLAAAEEAARELTDCCPNDSFGWKALGTILAQRGRSQDALAPLRQAIALAPQEADTHNSLGSVLQSLGCLDEAICSYKRAMRLRPDYAAAHNNLGNCLRQMGRWGEALASFDRALAITPNDVEVQVNRSLALQDLHRIDDALAGYRRALEISPDDTGARFHLGNACMQLEQWEEARACYERVLAAQPNLAEAHNNLGVAFKNLLRLEDAVASFQRAAQIKPWFADACNNLGVALQELGDGPEALASFRRALENQPENTVFRSNYLFRQAFVRGAVADSEYADARNWERSALSAAERKAARQRRFENAARHGRPLRLGIVSAELGHHAVSYFLTSWLRALDRKRIQVLLYPTSERPATETAAIASLSDQWTPLWHLADAEAAARIRADRVDVLLDTSGHMRGNRLGIFAHRAAPVQGHYIGYFATTGLTEMDYFLADEILVPPALDILFRETVWRLPRVWVAYAPVVDAPEVAWKPAAQRGVRLGSFNNLNKVSAPCLALWARILGALPTATLLLKDQKAMYPDVRSRLLRTLCQHGVDGDRVEFLPWSADWRSHMSLYDRVDIALDTFPLGSGTTGFDALWMGVPLITLAGDWMGGRMGAAMLTALGTPEWIASTEDEYVERTVALARDEDLRMQLRVNQRTRMLRGPLGDTRGMAHALSDAFEAMFDKWWSERDTS